MTTRGRLLGIDHGLARIGLAVSDPTATLARELAIVKRTSKQADFQKINYIAAEQRVVGVVIGLPSNLDAEPDAHTQADTVRHWADEFARDTTLPMVFWDEQMTSLDAAELARQKRRKPRDPLDDLAARLILQSYLDALRDGLTEWPF
jgi:putative Holliday junction resolvase